MLNRRQTLALVVYDLIDRAELGLIKYGHGVEESPDDMMQHLYEELLDASMYIKTQIERNKRSKEVNDTCPLSLGDYV